MRSQPKRFQLVWMHALSPVLVIVVLSVALFSAWADPPPWPPAHGWRKKHDPYYVGYEGRHWPIGAGVVLCCSTPLD